MEKRIFVAVDISDQAKRRVSEYAETLRTNFPNVRAGWEKSEKLHITLKFLGDIDEVRLKNLAAAVSNVAGQFAAFKLQISHTGVFSSPRDARILWLGVNDVGENLSKISELLGDECAKIGFTKEKRKFKAHLTVARLREPHKSKEIAERHLENKFEPVEFGVSEIVIFESRLQPSGSNYFRIHKYNLHGEATIKPG